MKYNPVLDIEVFLSLNREERGFTKLQTSLTKIHDKMVFDAFNQMMNGYRIGRCTGGILPTKILYFQTKVEYRDLEWVLRKVEQDLLEANQIMYGFLNNKRNSFLNLPANLDEEVMSEIRASNRQKYFFHEVNALEE